jgi:hypothetical protein
MRKLLFISFTIFSACSSTRHGANLPGLSSGSLQDGTSYENAVVIQEKSESAGVTAEYKWIREHYPGSRTKMQALHNKNGKTYDVLSIVTANGAEQLIYFDISRFYGKP